MQSSGRAFPAGKHESFVTRTAIMRDE
jgi:hypothetical protein